MISQGRGAGAQGPQASRGESPLLTRIGPEMAFHGHAEFDVLLVSPWCCCIFKCVALIIYF